MGIADDDDLIEPGDDALRGANLTPAWLAAPVLVALGLHLVLALGATVALGIAHDGELSDAAVPRAAALALIPALTMLWVEARRPERGNPGDVLVRWGFHLPVIVVLAVITGPLTLVVTEVAVKGLDLDGLDYVMGGATLGAVGAGLGGCVLALIVGGSLTFYLRMAGRLPLYLRLASLPLLWFAAATLATSTPLAAADVDYEDGTRRLGPVIGVVMGTVEISSEAWQLVCRISVVLLGIGFASLLVARKRLRAERAQTESA